MQITQCLLATVSLLRRLSYNIEHASIVALFFIISTSLSRNIGSIYLISYRSFGTFLPNKLSNSNKKKCSGVVLFDPIAPLKQSEHVSRNNFMKYLSELSYVSDATKKLKIVNKSLNTFCYLDFRLRVTPYFIGANSVMLRTFSKFSISP